VNAGARRRQSGITAIGFLVLASVFGLVGLAALKIVPLYLQKMRLTTIMHDMAAEFSGGAALTPQSIRIELLKRASVEGVNIPTDSIKITQVKNGYQVQVTQEQRTPFVADLWFVVVVDEQVEIER